MTSRVTHLLGIAGVNPGERQKALLWAQRLEWPILLVALWIPVQWYLEETGAVGLQAARWFDWAIWLVFLCETTLLTSLVRDKKRYLLSNWMNLVIILGGVPFEWTYTPLIGAIRNLRLLLMLFLLMRLSSRLRAFLVRGHIGTILVMTGVVVVLSGIIENRLDPSIGSIWDGMWYAWVTISHTGYGDVVPKTPAGRFFGGLLILIGIVLVAVITANLSALLIGSEVEKVEREVEKDERETDALMRDIVARLERIERRLDERPNPKGSP